MSNFVDVTVTLQATFNTGNFGNVRPEVTLTRKVEVGKLSEEYNDLLECAEAMFALQNISLMNEVRTANGSLTGTVNSYLRGLEENQDRMLSIIDDYQEKHK